MSASEGSGGSKATPPLSSTAGASVSGGESLARHDTRPQGQASWTGGRIESSIDCEGPSWRPNSLPAGDGFTEDRGCPGDLAGHAGGSGSSPFLLLRSHPQGYSCHQACSSPWRTPRGRRGAVGGRHISRSRKWPAPARSDQCSQCPAKPPVFAHQRDTHDVGVPSGVPGNEWHPGSSEDTPGQLMLNPDQQSSVAKGPGHISEQQLHGPGDHRDGHTGPGVQQFRKRGNSNRGKGPFRGEGGYLSVDPDIRESSPVDLDDGARGMDGEVAVGNLRQSTSRYESLQGCQGPGDGSLCLTNEPVGISVSSAAVPEAIALPAQSDRTMSRATSRPEAQGYHCKPRGLRHQGGAVPARGHSGRSRMQGRGIRPHHQGDPLTASDPKEEKQPLPLISEYLPGRDLPVEGHDEYQFRPNYGTLSGPPYLCVEDHARLREGLSRGGRHGDRNSSSRGATSEAIETSIKVEQVQCIICCEKATEIAVGCCDHPQVCARCSLRLRICYKDQRCPLCKTKNEVVLYMRPPARYGAPNFTQLRGSAQNLHRIKWLKGGYVYETPQDAKRGSLHSLLRRITCRSCSICDPSGRICFANDKLLQQHVKTTHGRDLCGICMRMGRKFALELDTYVGSGLKQHIQEAHRQCEFCNIPFYGDDELYHHMIHEHFTCYVCQRAGVPHWYFQNLVALLEHYTTQHHPCVEPECVELMVVFATAEDLKQHCSLRHTSRMPRWDNSRARPLLLDYGTRASRGFHNSGVSTASHGQGSTRSTVDETRRGGRAGLTDDLVERGSADGWLNLGADFPALGSEAAVRSEGGLTVIDDDLVVQQTGSVPPVLSGPSPTERHREPAGTWPWRKGPPAPDTGAEFPALQPLPGPSSGPAVHKELMLERVTRKCSCGQKKETVTVSGGTSAPPSACDAQCQQHQRRAQLAAAFGVSDPDLHVPVVDRLPGYPYSIDLLKVARSNMDWVLRLEQELARFLHNSHSHLLSLPPMTHNERAFVHGYTSHYLLVTRSAGQEPRRSTQIFKGANAKVPERLLSQVALSLTSADMMLLTKPEAKYILRLKDIVSGANLHHYLHEWMGHYVLEYEDKERRSALVSFTNQGMLKACSDVLAGGVRGVFLVDRSRSFAAAASSNEPPSKLGAAPTRHSSAPHRPVPQLLSLGKAPKRGGPNGVSLSSGVPEKDSGWTKVQSGRGRGSSMRGTSEVSGGPPVLECWKDDADGVRVDPGENEGGPSGSRGIEDTKVVDDWELAVPVLDVEVLMCPLPSFAHEDPPATL